MNVDDVLRSIKPWGRYQIILVTVACTYGAMLPALHIISFIYIVDVPTHFCKPYDGYDKSDVIPVSKVYSNDIVEYESCLIYRMENGTLTNQTINCPDGNEYTLSEGESTVVNELDLVCDRKLMASTVISVYFCGVLLGSLVTGITSDYFGRRMVFLTASFLIGVFGIGLTFTTTYYSFAAVWFLTAVAEQCVDVPAYVLVMEMFPPKNRTVAGCISNVTWSLAIALLPVYAYFLRDWRHMQLAISTPCLTSVFLWWFIYESPRWLISKGRLKDADDVFRKIAKFNKVELKETYIQVDNSEMNTAEEDGTTKGALGRTDGKHDKKKERTHTIIDVLRSPRMCRTTLITYFLFLTNNLVWFGMSINSSELYGDKYLNMFLACLVDVPSGISALILLPRFNRRPLLSIFLLAAAVFSLISALTPLTTSDGTNLYPVILGAACLGKYAIGSSYSIIWLYGNEIFPTELRNTGFGTCSFSARIGSIIAPYFMYLNTLHDGGALICFGVIAAVGCLSVYLLPETRNRPLPETMAEGEDLHSGRTIDRSQATKA